MTSAQQPSIAGSMRAGSGRRSDHRLALAAGLGICLMLLGACAKTASTSAAAATLGEVKGKVTLNGGSATLGAALKEGDSIHVPEGAMARVDYPDKSQFLVLGLTSEGADWSPGPVRKDGTLTVMLVRLGRGVVSFFVTPEPSPTRRFEIEAESSLTVVRGTEGKVQITTTGDVVALKHGEVTVQNKAGSATVTIHQGQLVTVGKDGTVGAPAAYDFSTSEEQRLYKGGTLLLKSFGGG